MSQQDTNGFAQIFIDMANRTGAFSNDVFQGTEAGTDINEKVGDMIQQEVNAKFDQEAGMFGGIVDLFGGKEGAILDELKDMPNEELGGQALDKIGVPEQFQSEELKGIIGEEIKATIANNIDKLDGTPEHNQEIGGELTDRLSGRSGEIADAAMKSEGAEQFVGAMQEQVGQVLEGGLESAKEGVGDIAEKGMETGKDIFQNLFPALAGMILGAMGLDPALIDKVMEALGMESQQNPEVKDTLERAEAVAQDGQAQGPEGAAVGAEGQSTHFGSVPGFAGGMIDLGSGAQSAGAEVGGAGADVGGTGLGGDSVGFATSGIMGEGQSEAMAGFGELLQGTLEKFGVNEHLAGAIVAAITGLGDIMGKMGDAPVMNMAGQGIAGESQDIAGRTDGADVTDSVPAPDEAVAHDYEGQSADVASAESVDPNMDIAEFEAGAEVDPAFASISDAEIADAVNENFPDHSVQDLGDSLQAYAQAEGANISPPSSSPDVSIPDGVGVGGPG